MTYNVFDEICHGDLFFGEAEVVRLCPPDRAAAAAAWTDIAGDRIDDEC